MAGPFLLLNADTLFWTVSNETEIDFKTQLEALAVDSTILHKKFGKGSVVKINKNEKFIHIKFTLGEKKFIFSDAFLMGFLEME